MKINWILLIVIPALFVASSPSVLAENGGVESYKAAALAENPRIEEDYKEISSVYQDFMRTMKAAYIEQGGSGWPPYLVGQAAAFFKTDHTGYIQAYPKAKEELALKLCNLHYGGVTKENYQRELRSLPNLYDSEAVALEILITKMKTDYSLKKSQRLANDETGDVLTEADMVELKSGKSPEIAVYKTKINKYQFTYDYIESIAYMNQSFNRISNFQAASHQNQNDEQIDLIKSLYMANSDLTQAKYKLSDYTHADNKYIRKYINMICKYYDELIALHLDGIQSLQYTSNPKNADSFDQGKMNNFNAQLGAKIDQILEALCMQSPIVAQILVRPEPGKDGKMSVIDLTREERNNLIKKIDDMFGDEAKNGAKNAPNMHVFPAAGLREFLTKDFTPKDEIAN